MKFLFASTILIMKMIQETNAQLFPRLDFGLWDFLDPLGTVRKRKYRCLTKFLQTGFEPFAFDRYPDFFKEDSVMILAQAGAYYGTGGIEEYVRFASPSSPYMATFNEDDEAPYVLGYNEETNECEYLYAVKTTNVWEPNTTKGFTHEMVQMAKLILDYDGVYFKRANIYYATPTLQMLFGDLFVTPQMTNFVCNTVLNTACSEALGGPVEDCEARLDALPPAEGENLYVDGNSLGCRILHASFAATNPVNHCPHVALNATADPLGLFKCQSGGEYQVEDLFTEFDLEFFKQVAERNGIDGDQGFKMISRTPMN